MLTTLRLTSAAALSLLLCATAQGQGNDGLWFTVTERPASDAQLAEAERLARNCQRKLRQVRVIAGEGIRDGITVELRGLRLFRLRYASPQQALLKLGLFSPERTSRVSAVHGKTLVVAEGEAIRNPRYAAHVLRAGLRTRERLDAISLQGFQPDCPEPLLDTAQLVRDTSPAPVRQALTVVEQMRASGVGAQPVSAGEVATARFLDKSRRCLLVSAPTHTASFSGTGHTLLEEARPGVVSISGPSLEAVTANRLHLRALVAELRPEEQVSRR
jgi:hypothetical protein